MYVVNPEVLDQDNLFYCGDEYTVQRLLDDGIVYLSILHQDMKMVWVFAKTQQLIDKLNQYEEERVRNVTRKFLF